MRKINVEIECHNDTEVSAELEHISILIDQGYNKGDGWQITGEAEKETLPVNDDEDDKDEPTEDIREQHSFN